MTWTSRWRRPRHRASRDSRTPNSGWLCSCKAGGYSVTSPVTQLRRPGRPTTLLRRRSRSIFQSASKSSDSVVVLASPDSATHGPEDQKNQTDHEHDDANAPQDRDFGDEADHHKDNAEDNHRGLLWSLRVAPPAPQTHNAVTFKSTPISVSARPGRRPGECP